MMKSLVTRHAKQHIGSIAIRLRVAFPHRHPEIINQDDFIKELVRPLLFVAGVKGGGAHAHLSTLTSNLAEGGTEIVFLVGVLSPEIAGVLLASIRKPILDLIVSAAYRIINIRKSAVMQAMYQLKCTASWAIQASSG
jgi:hypothetical protein